MAQRRLERRQALPILAAGTVATAEESAAFRVEHHTTLSTITPLTPAADRWLQSAVPRTQAMWDGNTLVVELRYFPSLADAIIAAGFKFERD